MYVGAKKRVLLATSCLTPKGVNPVIAAVIWVIEVFSTFLLSTAVRLFWQHGRRSHRYKYYLQFLHLCTLCQLLSISASTAAQQAFRSSGFC